MTTVQWMLGDANIVGHAAAKLNPMRWNSGKCAAVALVILKGYQIYQRTGLCLSQDRIEFTKEMGQLGFGFLGGMLGSTLGAALLAGFPGMVLGGVLGADFGTLLGNVWSQCLTSLSNYAQLGDRSDLAEVGFMETQLPIFRVFCGGSWQGHAQTQLLLRVLSNPAAASALDIEAARSALTQSYRRKSLQVHPDRGGSHEDFVNLHRAYETLLDPMLGAATSQSPQHAKGYALQ